MKQQPYGESPTEFESLLLYISGPCWAYFFSRIAYPQALVPLFFSAVFFVLGYVPELAFLEKWIEGMGPVVLGNAISLSVLGSIKVHKT